jgi:hypothetical protein
MDYRAFQGSRYLEGSEMQAGWWLLAVVVSAAAMWMMRYEVQPSGSAIATAFILDRWTGNVRFCAGAECDQ